MKKIKAWTKTHWIRLIVFIIILSLTTWLFFGQFSRTLVSLKVLGQTLIYYVVDFYVDDPARPLQPFDIIIGDALLDLIIPVDFDVFLARLKLTYSTLINRDIFEYYLVDVKNVVAFVARWGFLASNITLIAILVHVVTNRFRSKESEPVDSQPLQLFKRFTKKVVDPFRTSIKNLVNYFFGAKWFMRGIVILLIVSLSMITIALDTVSTYLYTLTSLDLSAIWKYLIMILIDVIPIIQFFPGFIQVLFAYLVFDRIRLFFAFKRLLKNEKSNEDFIQGETGTIVMVCGAMGSNKTKTIQSMSQVAELLLRKQLLEIIKEIEKKFIHFPWQKINMMIDSSPWNFKTPLMIYNYVNNLKLKFNDFEKSALDKKIILFDYDFEKYGINVYDELINESIFSALVDYITAYSYYRIPKALAFGNLPISYRTPFGTGTINSYFPTLKVDYYRSGIRDLNNRALSIIINNDFHRLGKKFKTYSSKEFFIPTLGIFVRTEDGKERGSHDQVQTDKNESDTKKVTRSNDGYIERLKIERHIGQIRHRKLIKLFLDEQRKKNINTDIRQVTETVITLDKAMNKKKFALKFWFLERMLCEFILELRDNKRYEKISKTRKKTLKMYLSDIFIDYINNYYTRRINLFTYLEESFPTENSSLEEVSTKKGKGRWFLNDKKEHADTYSDTHLKTFFFGQMASATLGIEDLKRYQSTTPTNAELKSQNAIFLNYLYEMFYGKELI